MIKLNKIVILTIFTSILTFGSTKVTGQERKSDLKDKQITIEMTQKPLYTIFWRLIQKYDVAIGMEESTLDREHRHYEFEQNIEPEDFKENSYRDKEVPPPFRTCGEHFITVNFKDARLEDVMDSIVNQMKHYDWEITDDVVNIFPTSGRDLRLQKLLNIKVSLFAIPKGAEVGYIHAQLMLFNLEFKKFIAENDIESTTLGRGSAFERRILPNEMVFKDKTFKELLNAITKSKRGGWMLKIKKLKSKPGKEFVEILI